MTSVLLQSFQEWQLIIIDDGSSDRTSDIAQAIARSDSRIELVTLPKQLNLGSVLNAGLRRARGEFVARLDADDFANPRRLEIMVDAMRRQPEVAVLGSAVIDVEGRTGRIQGSRRPSEFHADIAVELLARNPIVHPSVMIRREPLTRVGGYPEADLVEDYALWSIMVREGLTLRNLSSPLIEMTHHPGQVTQRHAREMSSAFERIQAEYARWFFGQCESSEKEKLHRWVILWSRLLRGINLDGAQMAELRDSTRLVADGRLAAGSNYADRLRAKAEQLLRRFVPPNEGVNWFPAEARDYVSLVRRRMGGYESDVPSHALSTVELWRSVSDTVTVPGKFAVGPRTEDFLAQFVGPVVLTTRLRSNYADMVVIGDAGDSEQRSAGLERFESEFARYRADRDLVAAAVGSNVCADPTVFKVFCSRGRVLAILADRRLADMRQVQLFGRDFNHPRKLRLRGGSAHRRVVAGLQPPEPEAVLSPARKVSCQLDTAFARIDFIWSDGGPILLGVQLVPSDFMPHDSLVAPPSLLRDLAEAWAVAGDSRSFTLVRPAAKFDPRPWDAQHLTDENGA